MMPWFKVDDGFHGHPKVVELSLEAVGVWTLAGSWCASYLTDGEIGLKSIRRLGGSAEQAQELVYAGLWLEPEPGLYQFKDWEDYQPLKAAVEAEREAAKERMKAVRAKKKGVSVDVQPNVPPNTSGTSSEVPLTPSLPSPSLPDLLLFPGSEENSPKLTGRRSPERPLPADWRPNEKHRADAEEKYLSVDILAQAFKNHAEAHDRRVRNWDAAFRNWIFKATPGTAPESNPWSPEFHKKGLHA